jgi:hypothetical protein
MERRFDHGEICFTFTLDASKLSANSIVLCDGTIAITPRRSGAIPR